MHSLSAQKQIMIIMLTCLNIDWSIDILNLRYINFCELTAVKKFYRTVNLRLCFTREFLMLYALYYKTCSVVFILRVFMSLGILRNI